jgi:hypothetical protein
VRAVFGLDEVLELLVRDVGDAYGLNLLAL